MEKKKKKKKWNSKGKSQFQKSGFEQNLNSDIKQTKFNEIYLYFKIIFY